MDFPEILLAVGLLVLVGIAAAWKRGPVIGPLLAGGGLFLTLASDLGKILDGSPGELIGMAVVTAAAFVLARIEPRIEGIAWIASGMVPLLLAAWPVVAGRESPAILLTGGILLAGAAYGAGWGAPRPARWTALSALAGVAFLVLAVSRYGENKLWWSGLALAGAAVFAGLALLTARRQSLAAAAPLAAAAATLCAFGVTLEVERGWFDVGVALAVPLLVWLFPKLPSPPLRSLTLVLAALSVLRLGLDREDFGFPDGGLVDFPWLLYAYGVPLAAMLVAVWLARRQGETRVADCLEWAALGFLLLLVLLSVRQVYPEKGTAVLVLLGVGIFFAFGIYRARREPGGWEPRTASVRLFLFFSVALGVTGVEAAGQARLYSRPVDVPAEGPVRVPLDLATLRHLGAEGEGVRVFGPDGEEVRSRLEPFPREGERSFNSASVLNLGWDKEEMVVEIAPEAAPPASDQILFSSGTNDFGAVPGLRPQGSEDGRRWHSLGASVDFFEVWRGNGIPGEPLGSLLLPPGTPRFLRLALPVSLRWAELSGLPARTLVVMAERPGCRREEDLTVCALALPARHQRPLRFAFELADRSEVGIRLFALQDGVLQSLAQGVSRPAPGGSRHVVPLALEKPLATRMLRLELQARGAPPRPVRAILTLAQPVAVFEAPRPGRYRLAYGGGGGLELPGDSDVPGDAAWIEPGPESARELPLLPDRLIRPAVRLGGSFGWSWMVESRGASPGEVVRLEIPDEVHARSQAGLADVRLEVGGLQIPYVRRSLDEPARMVGVRGARLEKRFPGERRLDIPLPQPRLPLTTCRLTAPPDSKEFREWPSLSPMTTGGSGWHCHPQPLLPCQWNAAAKEKEGRAFEPVVTIANLRIPTLDVSLWRRRDALVFVWPEGGPVRLVTGDRERGAPGYDLALIESQILARPWRPASLGPREASIPWLRLPLVVLAGGALLVLLRRKLPVAPPPGQG